MIANTSRIVRQAAGAGADRAPWGGGTLIHGAPVQGRSRLRQRRRCRSRPVAHWQSPGQLVEEQPRIRGHPLLPFLLPAGRVWRGIHQNERGVTADLGAEPQPPIEIGAEQHHEIGLAQGPGAGLRAPHGPGVTFGQNPPHQRQADDRNLQALQPRHHLGTVHVPARPVAQNQHRTAGLPQAFGQPVPMPRLRQGGFHDQGRQGPGVLRAGAQHVLRQIDVDRAWPAAARDPNGLMEQAGDLPWGAGAGRPLGDRLKQGGGVQLLERPRVVGDGPSATEHQKGPAVVPRHQNARDGVGHGRPCREHHRPGLAAGHVGRGRRHQRGARLRAGPQHQQAHPHAVAEDRMHGGAPDTRDPGESESGKAPRHQLMTAQGV